MNSAPFLAIQQAAKHDAAFRHERDDGTTAIRFTGPQATVYYRASLMLDGMMWDSDPDNRYRPFVPRKRRSQRAEYARYRRLHPFSWEAVK